MPRLSPTAVLSTKSSSDATSRSVVLRQKHAEINIESTLSSTRIRGLRRVHARIHGRDSRVKQSDYCLTMTTHYPDVIVIFSSAEDT